MERLPWIIWEDPNYNPKCSYKEVEGNLTQTEEETDVTIEVSASRIMRIEVKDSLEPPEAGEKQVLQSLQKEHSTALPTPGFWPK